MAFFYSFITMVTIGWPGLVAGYCWAAFSSGWSAGLYLHSRDENAAIHKYCRKD